MWPMIGGLISGGLNLFGGLLNSQNSAAINQQNIAMQESTNRENIAAQEAINAQNIGFQSGVNQQNLQEQKDFAQHGVQWRAADARAAGISPLAALGANTGSFTNLVAPQAGALPSAVAPQARPSDAFGSGVARMGQDISRAIAATRSPEEQAVAIEKTRQDLEAGQLDNDLKRMTLSSGIMRLHSAQIGPGIPSSAPKDIGNELARAVDQNGNPVFGPSRGTEGWSWSNPVAKDQYFNRDVVEPTFGYNIPKDVGPASPGKSWYMNPFTGRYYQMAPFLSSGRTPNRSGITPRNLWQDLGY